MKIIFLLLSGLFFFQINVLSQNGLFDERDKLYYREIISLYPKFLVSHLPENIDNKVSGAQSLLFPRGKYLNYIHLTLPCGNSKREILKKEMASQAKRIYYLGDSCLTLPYDYENFEIIKSDSIRNLPFVDTLQYLISPLGKAVFLLIFIKKLSFIFLLRRKVVSCRMIAFRGMVLVCLTNGYMAIQRDLSFISTM